MKRIFEYLLRALPKKASSGGVAEWHLQVRYESVDRVLARKMCRRLKQKARGVWKLRVMPLQEKTPTDVIGVLTGMDGTRQVCREVWRTQESNGGRKKLLIEMIQTRVSAPFLLVLYSILQVTA